MGIKDKEKNNITEKSRRKQKQRNRIIITFFWHLTIRLKPISILLQIFSRPKASPNMKKKTKTTSKFSILNVLPVSRSKSTYEKMTSEQRINMTFVGFTLYLAFHFTFSLTSFALPFGTSVSVSVANHAVQKWMMMWSARDGHGRIGKGGWVHAWMSWICLCECSDSTSRTLYPSPLSVSFGY